jgi:hypothetical protein
MSFLVKVIGAVGGKGGNITDFNRKGRKTEGSPESGVWS